MQNTKVKGLVLFSRDYQESDKLLNILTLEQGKITVKAKSVRTAKSKLKMYAQSFCFAEFELTKKQDMYLLTGVNPIDSFFNIVSDIDKFESGFKILECIDKVCKTGQTYVEVFVEALKALKTLCYTDISPDLITIKFMTQLLSHEGFKLNLDRCSMCKSKFVGKIYLNIDEGELVCSNCHSPNCVEIAPAVYNGIRLIANSEYELLKNLKLKDNIVASISSVLVGNFENKFMCKLKSTRL